MGLSELIADDLEALAAISLKIGKDGAYREKLSSQIMKKLPELIADKTSQKEWDALLKSAVHMGKKGTTPWLPR